MQGYFWKGLLEQLKNGDCEHAGLSFISQDVISSPNSAKQHMSLSISYDCGPSIHFRSWQLLVRPQVSIHSLVQFHEPLLKTFEGWVCYIHLLSPVPQTSVSQWNKTYVPWTSRWSIHQTVHRANALLCSLAHDAGRFPKNHFLGWSHLHFPSRAFPPKAVHTSGRKILSY